MKIASTDLRPGDRVLLPEVVCEHVIVIGPSWKPSEVWLSDKAGHVFTLDPDAKVELISSALQ